MQAFVHLTLFTLLFVISATAATSSTPTAITGNTGTAPALPTTSAPANSATTSASAGPTTPAPANSATTSASAGPTTPAGANSATTSTSAGPTTPAGANSATTSASAGPTTPAGANSATTSASAGPTTPAPANSATTSASAGPTTPAPANSATTSASAGPTTPAPANSATTSASAGPTTPTGVNNVTSTGANNTAPTPATPTAPAGTNNTTPAPATPTAPTTFIKDNSLGTVPSVTSSNVTSLKTSNPNPDTANLCQVESCAGGSYCVNLNSTHVCLCIDGFYYNSSICKKGKVFPGIIQVKTPDTNNLDNRKSINYEKLHKEVIKFFEGAFKNLDYGQTVIQQVSPPTPGASQMYADDKVVTVTVANLFAEDTKETETTIAAAIHNAISNSSNIVNYTNQDHCEFYGCKKGSNCSNGFHCECREGYERPDPYTATCLPLRCPSACTLKPNTQCLVKKDGSSDCVCLAGYKKDDHGTCQACAFGYNGVNCEDNFQLILTILGTVAGILILGMVIALILVRSKKTKDSEEQHLIENDFQNLKLQQTTGFSFPEEGSIFPKITTSFPRDSGMHNPYANPRGMPRPDY